MNSEGSVDILLEKSVQLERLVAELYLLFAGQFLQDAPFWLQLCEEEKQHAHLLESIRSSLAEVNRSVSKIVASSVDDLRQSIKELETFTETCRNAALTRELAFHAAIRFEESAGEIHYQEFMESNPGTPIYNIFRQLNKDDKDHAERIRSYMKEKNIALPAENQI